MSSKGKDHLWIVVYCVLQSLANPLNNAIGVAYAASAAFCVLQTVVLFTFIRKNNLLKRYGLCKSPVPARRFLYYVPLVILASGNLWNGFALNYSPAETACRIVCMLCVGFLEEVIFRGLLFKAIAKDNIKSAVIISSMTCTTREKERYMREKDIEKKLSLMVKKAGGIAVKFVSPSFDGMPDRLVLLPDGVIAFVELKAPGKTPRPLQLARHRLLRSLGFWVYVIDGTEQIGGMLDELRAT